MLQTAKNRLLKGAAVVEFKAISNMVLDFSIAYKDSYAQNLEGVLTDIDVIVKRLADFRLDFESLLKP